jgi:ferredoxin
MFATVDRSCIGCGSCVEVCPEVFKMNDEGLAEAHSNPVPSEIEVNAQEAADICPVEAIILE